ncbi:MAG: UDP binding domain-containing protein, partial [Hyphomicrobiales bacterium]
GPGYGGSCFPKDTKALAQTATEFGASVSIVDAVIKANDARKKRMADRIVKVLGGSVSGKRIAILGVTFKPNTDDMRDAPSLDIIPALQEAGAAVAAFDPEGMHEAEHLMPDVTWAEDAYAPMEGADALVILTEWNEFRALDLKRIKSLLLRPTVIDLRNIYPPEEMANAGLSYYSVGRTAVMSRP